MRQLKDWALLHKCAEANASEAELAEQKGDVELAWRLYGVAAVLEHNALGALAPHTSQIYPRTYAIAAVRAVSYYYQAGYYDAAELLAHEVIAGADLPKFAREQLVQLLCSNGGSASVAGHEMKRWPRPKVVRAEARIDAMLAHPHYWGGAEAYELQLLLAMEFAEERNVQQDYSVFLAGTRPEVGARPLSAVTSDLEEIASAMRDFRGWLAARKSS